MASNNGGLSRQKRGNGKGGVKNQAGSRPSNKANNKGVGNRQNRNNNRNNSFINRYRNNPEDLDEENAEDISGEEEGGSGGSSSESPKNENGKNGKNGKNENQKNGLVSSIGGGTSSSESNEEGKLKIKIPVALKVKIIIGGIVVLIIASVFMLIAATAAAIFGGIDDTGKVESYVCETVNIIDCESKGSNYVLQEGERLCDDVLIEHGLKDSVTSTSYVYLGTYSNVDFERYVAGVTDAEVGASCEESKCKNKEEVLKAFAVASRSAAQRRITQNQDCYVESSDRFQKYVNNIASRSIKAAEATEGEVIIDKDGKTISATYDAFACYKKETDEYGETWYYLKQPILTGDKIPESWLKEKVPNIFNLEKYPWTTCEMRQAHGRGASQFGAYYMADVFNYDYKELIYYYYEAYTDGTADKIEAEQEAAKKQQQQGN